MIADVLGILIRWTTHLATHFLSRPVPALVDDGCDRVADNSLTTMSVTDKVSSRDDRSLKKYFIPNTLATWPWPRRLNQYYPEVGAESSAWITSFQAFSPKAQEAFNRCDFGLLSCLTYPTASKEHIRVVCDWMNTTFFIDEQTDVSEEHEIRKQKKIMMDALHNPHEPRPVGEWIGGEVVRQYWERAILHASARAQKRFIAKFDQYMEAMVQEAIDRSGRLIRDIESYTNMRRNTIGIKPCFALSELGLDIPDDIISHPLIKDMEMASNDMTCLTNDMVSYNIEQARGDSHNIVAIVMHELDTDVNGAMLWIANRHKETEIKFLEAMAALPNWGEPIDSHVRQYCDYTAHWVRGNYEWSFETERYFGRRGPEIKMKRWNTLMPPKDHA